MDKSKRAAIAEVAELLGEDPTGFKYKLYLREGVARVVAMYGTHKKAPSELAERA